MEARAFSGWLFLLLGWPEIIGLLVILLVLLVVAGARKLSKFWHHLGPAWREFSRATEELTESLNPNQKESGLVYEALTPNNLTAEFAHPRRSELAELLRTMILFFAQGFGVGRLPFAPGLFGSLVGLLWFAILLNTGQFWFYLAGTIFGLAVSVWLCGAAEKILKQTDPSSVVLDEVTAIPICYLGWVAGHWFNHKQMPSLEVFFTAQSWLITVGLFALFRILDILKPWPIRPLQKLPGGWGITADDWLAATFVSLISLVFVQ